MTAGMELGSEDCMRLGICDGMELWSEVSMELGFEDVIGMGS